MQCRHRTFVLLILVSACADSAGNEDADVRVDGGIDVGVADGGADVAFPDAGPFEGDNDYFDFLVEQPEQLHNRAYRSMEAILEDAERTMTRIDYDPAQDAARWTFGPDVGSMSSSDQLRSFYSPISDVDRNALFYWEARWDSSWVTNAGGIETHKAFQIGGIEAGGTPRGLEPRTRFGRAMEGMVANLDCRIYGWSPTTPGPADTFAELDTEFHVAGQTWTRFWLYVDFENLQITQWVGDETRAPRRIYDRSQFDAMDPANLESFWFEFNSSQSRTDPATLFIWGRNLVVLTSLSSLDAVQSLVSQGDQTR